MILEVLLIRARELLPLPQLLPDAHSAQLIALLHLWEERGGLRFLHVLRHPERLRQTLSRTQTVVHITPQVFHPCVVANAANRFKHMHMLTSV